MSDPTQTPPPETPAVVPPVIPQPNPLELQLQQMQQTMLQQQQEIARLGNIAQQVINPPAPAPQTPDFYTDPKGAIREEVKASIAPLNAFMQMFQNTQTYNANKAQLLNVYPNLQAYWNVLAPKLDNIFASGEVNPSMQNIEVAVNNIMGQLLMSNPAQFQTPTPVTPPIIPPSIGGAPPAAPPANPNAPKVILTENQKVIARASGMTDEEFARGLGGQTIIRV